METTKSWQCASLCRFSEMLTKKMCKLYKPIYYHDLYQHTRVCFNVIQGNNQNTCVNHMCISNYAYKIYNISVSTWG